MPFFVMIGHDGPRGGELRPSVRPRHLSHLAPLASEGRIAYAGPIFEDDGSTPRGSVIVLEASSLAEARAIAARDPYVVEGVFGRYDVQPSARVFPAAD